MCFCKMREVAPIEINPHDKFQKVSFPMGVVTSGSTSFLVIKKISICTFLPVFGLGLLNVLPDTWHGPVNTTWELLVKKVKRNIVIKTKKS